MKLFHLCAGCGMRSFLGMDLMKVRTNTPNGEYVDRVCGAVECYDQIHEQQRRRLLHEYPAYYGAVVHAPDYARRRMENGGRYLHIR